MFKKTTLFYVIASTSILFVANSALAKGSAKEGKKVYEANCATCHGVKGKGDGAVGAALNPKPRNFVEGKFKYGSTDKDLFKTISNGKGIMPSWKASLNEKQINDVIAYVRTFKK